LDPQGVYPRELPAPPRVVVWAAGDIADDVRAYAERREAEKSRYPS
jgi:hypothetical protein